MVSLVRYVVRWEGGGNSELSWEELSCARVWMNYMNAESFALTISATQRTQVKK